MVEENSLMRLIADGMRRKGIQTQKELADRSGVHRSVVSRLFCGRNLSGENVFRLLTFLDLVRDTARIDHEEQVEQFRNRELAAELNRRMRDLERFGEHHLLDLKHDMDTRLRTLRLEKKDHP